MATQTFKEYLIELMVSDDPAQAIKDVKQAARNPNRYQMQQMAKTVNAQRDIQQAKDDPLKSEKLRLVKMQQQVAAQKKRLAQKQKREEKQAGVTPGAQKEIA